MVELLTFTYRMDGFERIPTFLEMCSFHFSYSFFISLFTSLFIFTFELKIHRSAFIFHCYEPPRRSLGLVVPGALVATPAAAR